MKIDELCEYAKENGFDTLKFEFVNLTGQIIKCKWADAYMGIFMFEGGKGFITITQWKKLTGDVFEFKIAGY